MTHPHFVLVTEGSSDAALEHPLRWLLQSNGVNRSIDGGWFDHRELPRKPRSLTEKIRAALDSNESCNLLFVHRDGDRECEPLVKREQEIREAIGGLDPKQPCPPHVCVIPVRMTEAWFLFEAAAIRMAVSNPRGKVALPLPAPNQVEGLDAKEVLRELMRTATELPHRRLRSFSEGASFLRLASLVRDFSPLRSLSSFKALERDIRNVIEVEGWNK